MSQSQSLANNEDDVVTLLFMLFGGLATGGFSIAVFLIPVRDWMVVNHILAAGDGVVIPFVDGIGFGWPQIVVAAGILVVGVLLFVWLRRRSQDRV